MSLPGAFPYRIEAKSLAGNETIQAHEQANQPNIISFGLSTLNSRSIRKMLTAYAPTIIAVPENQCPIPAMNKAMILSGSAKPTGTISRAKD